MPQSHYQIGSSLGEALSGAFSNSSYDKGRNAGLLTSRNEAAARKDEAEASLLKRQNELQNDDNIFATALQSAGISSADAQKFRNYMTNGTASEPPKPQTGIDIQSILNGVLKTGAPTNDYSAFIEPKQVAIAPDVTPQQRQQYELGMRALAAMRQALMQGDKNTTNATETSLANLTASGAGNNDVTLAQLLLHGKAPFSGASTGSTNEITGEQALNGIGRSQIAENLAQAFNANESAKKASREVEKAPKALSDEYKSIRDDIRADYNAEYPIDRYTGLRPKGSVSYDDYTKGWIRKHGINESSFFSPANQVAQPVATNQAEPRRKIQTYPTAPFNPKARKAGDKYDTPKGVLIWTGTGWIKP